jgi:hypothetical protein
MTVVAFTGHVAESVLRGPSVPHRDARAVSSCLIRVRRRCAPGATMHAVRSSTFTLLSFLAFGIAACTGDTDVGTTSTSAGDTGGCHVDCPYDQGEWICMCRVGTEWNAIPGGQFCADNPSVNFCVTPCRTHFPTHNALEVQPWVCDNFESDEDCDGWEPENFMYYNSGSDTYFVLRSWVAALVDDPSPLWMCDDARIEPGYDSFELVGGVAGEAFSELGLEDGDILVELNGMPLESWDDVLDAFVELWMNEEETEYELEIIRNSQTEFLNYELFDPQ